MRHITEEMSKAFYEGRNKSMSNTVVKFNEVSQTTEMFLHWNLIARLGRDGQLYLWSYKDEDFWFSNTTKERLNWILALWNLWKYIVKKGHIYRVKWEKTNDTMDKLWYEEIDIHWDF